MGTYPRYHQALRPATAKALALVRAGTHTPYAAARACGVSLNTIYRHVHKGSDKTHAAQIEAVAAEDVI